MVVSENFSEQISFLKSDGMEFHKYNSKSSGESLLIHSYNTYFLVSRVSKYIPNLTDDDVTKLKIASLLHDFGKTYGEFQSKLYGRHKLKDEDMPKVKELILRIKSFSDDELDDIIYIIQNHHSIDMEKVDTRRDRLTRIVSICDNVVSSQEINEEVVNMINGLIDSVKYECFAVELIEHPISSYVIGTFDYIYAGRGIEPILFAKDGTLFIKKKNQNLPSLKEVNKYLNEQIRREFSSEGILRLDNTNRRIYTSPNKFLLLASSPSKFLETVDAEVSRRLSGFKKREDWGDEKERIYLLGRVCGSTYNYLIETILDKARSALDEAKKESVVEKIKEREKAPFSAILGGRANEETAEFIEGKYGKGKSYKVILKSILEDFKDEINAVVVTIPTYDVVDLMVKDSKYQSLDSMDVQQDAKKDYDKYWEKDPIGVCRVCHIFKQEQTSAALFPASDLGGGKDVFLTDHMGRSPEFKDKGGVCKWCELWFMLLKNKTGNRMYKLCVVPHALFGRINWDDIFESESIISIGNVVESYIYPHVVVVGLSGKTYANFISGAVRRGIFDRLYENGLRGKVISTLTGPSSCLFDCGGIKITSDEYPLFKPIFENMRKTKGSNYFALAVKSLKNNKYSWGYLLTTGKVKNSPREKVVKMVENLGESTGLSFLKNIWVGGAGEDRISNAEKVVRRMNETLRKLGNEDKKVLIDAMTSIGRKVACSTRQDRDWADERRQKEVEALRRLAEKLYEHRDRSAQRTELVRAAACYLGYIPYRIGGE